MNRSDVVERTDKNKDFISIVVFGPKKARKKIIQKIYELCMSDDLLEGIKQKKGTTLNIVSSIESGDEDE